MNQSTPGRAPQSRCDAFFVASWIFGAWLFCVLVLMAILFAV